VRVLGKPSRQHRLKQELMKVSEFDERGDESPPGLSSFAKMPLCEPQRLNRGDMQVVAFAPHVVVCSMCTGAYSAPVMKAEESVEIGVSALLRADYEMRYAASKSSDAGVESQSDSETQSIASNGFDKTTSNAESLPTLFGRRGRCVPGEGVLRVKNTFLDFVAEDDNCVPMRRRSK
jgi:hypothetical protein